ncbi:MAG: hypothetical protein JXP34_02110 [Planctomycetes bacterium]|nr:hypothetical protein [Planctomycetota bacterium]
MRLQIALALSLAIACGGGIRAAETDPADAGTCTVSGNDVLLDWSGVIIIAIAFDTIAIDRDGQRIATLKPGATHYVDQNVPAGAHVYSVYGTWRDRVVVGMLTCTVTVPGVVPKPPYDLNCMVICRVVECFADPCPPLCAVSMTWKNGGRYSRIIIARDGEVIARIAGWETRYVDQPAPQGKHVYAVYGVLINASVTDLSVDDGSVTAAARCEVVVPGDPTPRPPHDLTCTVRCVDVECLVPPCPPFCVVTLAWENGGDYKAILIVRDAEKLIELPGDTTKWADENPGEGWHIYEVYGIVASGYTVPAVCRVCVPGGPLEPPTDLVCTTNLVLDPAAESDMPGTVAGQVLDPGDEPVPWPVRGVYLRWTNGAVYEAIRIDRDGEVVAKLPGFTQRWIDWRVEPGAHKYAVYGIRGNEITRPATCEIEVPEPVPAPEDLTCVALDPTAIPERQIVLAWTNPVKYDVLLLYRNGMQIKKLEGTATETEDMVPGIGRYAYALVGVIGGGHSAPARCVVVITGPVPPVEDLTCRVLVPVTDPATGVVADPVVVLRWRNPIAYDQILVFRDNGSDPVVLEGTAVSYHETGVPEGTHTYAVVGVLGDEKSEAATCEVEIPGEAPPPPANIVCGAEGQTVYLSWENPAKYDQILVCRDNLRCVSLPGDATEYKEENVPVGSHTYRVIGIENGVRSVAAVCTVVVIGPVEEDRLYFLSIVDSTASSEVPLPPADGTAHVLADNVDPLEGWSFGICNDPEEIRAVEVNLGEAAKALNGGHGPGFVAINIIEAESGKSPGVTVAVVVDCPGCVGADPGNGDVTVAETLPPGRAQELLIVQYEEVAPPSTPGPIGAVYPIGYCATLGEPPVAVLFVVDGFERRPRTYAGSVRFLTIRRFIRGDANANGSVEIGDAILILGYLFAHGEAPTCLETANGNGNEQLNLADPIYLLNFIFNNGPEPPAPYPDCGIDPDGAALGCESFKPCD